MTERLVRIYRGTIAESIHRGHIAVVDASGSLQAHTGDPGYVTYARSSAKPLQAIAVIESGASAHYGFTTEETALLCASHGGEEPHAAAAHAMLVKTGLGDEALQCGVHDPFFKPAADKLRAKQLPATSLHNNCSGKHAGMLALANYLRVPLHAYREPAHPVQRMMLQVIADMTGLDAAAIPLGTDGCGVPVFGLPLERLARAFAVFGAPDRLASGRAAACRTLIGALRQAPYFLAGTDRYDTRLIEVTKGRIVGKMGAEGVFALTVPDQKLGVAVKIEDGSPRALYPAVTEALVQLSLLTDAEREQLNDFHRPWVKNWQGTVVGYTEPCFTLR